MRKDIAGEGTESTVPTFEVLEALVREQAQELIQRVLEEEVTALGYPHSSFALHKPLSSTNHNGDPRPTRCSMAGAARN